jgi:armadillo repeat-containing protein 8
MITEAGVVKILCEHAHSTNARLRLNALWALKHFVNAVSNDLKRLCVEELGQGWLVQLICDDTEDEALLSSREKGERGLTSNEEMDEDVEMDQFEDQVDAAFAGSFGRSNSSRPSSSRSKSVQQAELRLAALREAETNPARKARKDDIAVQEQGLSFIRNLIGPTGAGASSEVTEMVDFLFNALGQDRVFEILASKLRPKVINPYNRRSTSETRVQPPQPEIIVAVSMILVHMAASVPRHRQIVIAQTELLKLLVHQFHHPNIEIRLALCHLATNLTWMDDTSDSKACTQRANELLKLNFLTQLEMLEQDPELNVRERAKSAVWQMKQSLGY